MADLSTLARPYAKAAFDYAKENHCIGEWQNYLAVMNAVVGDKAFAEYLHNPAVNAKNKVLALVDIYNHSVPEDSNNVFKAILAAIDRSHANKAHDKMSTAFTNFLIQLSEQDRLVLLPQINERFSLLQADDAKEVHAYVTSAYPLTKAQELLIENRLSTSLGSNVVIHSNVDNSLLAGVTIKIGDKLIDDSIRGKLQQLKNQLTA